MHSLVLLPFFPVLLWIFLKSTEDALIDIYIPVMVMFPMFAVFHVPHLMGFTAHDAALFPIVIAAFYKYGTQWRLQRIDLWIFLFIFGAAVAAARAEATQAIRAFFEVSFAIFLPYAAGRLLLAREGMRTRFLRRLCWVVAITAAISLLEFFARINVFNLALSKVFGQPPWNPEQTRGGFTRTQGPYTHAIHAGIICGSVLLFALWLRYSNRLKTAWKERKFLGIPSSNVMIGLIFLGLVEAFSRGPWIGFGLGLGFWWIGRSKNVARTAVIFALIAVIGGGCLYVYLKAYTEGSAQTEDQQNAIYRRELLVVYGKIADEGGAFGWGQNFPIVGNQDSIDNEYLYLHLTQGLVGLWTFNVISFEACLALFLAARRATQKVEFAFLYCLLGVVTGMLLTLTSVSLYAQPRELFFLCLGWIFSYRPEAIPVDAAVPVAAEEQPRFQRIFA